MTKEKSMATKEDSIDAPAISVPTPALPLTFLKHIDNRR